MARSPAAESRDPDIPMTIRLALCCDYLEEGWASMDLVGDMILGHLRRDTPPRSPRPA